MAGLRRGLARFDNERVIRTVVVDLGSTGLKPSLAFKPFTFPVRSFAPAVVARVFFPVCVREGVFMSSLMGALRGISDVPPKGIL